MHRIRVLPVVVLLLGVVVPAAAWVVRIQGDDGPSGVASGVAVGSDGAVIASGITRNAGSSYDWTIVELDATTGAEAWRYVLDGDDPEDDPLQGKFEVPNGPAIDPAGDVIVTGIVTGADFQTDVVVVKVDGDTGDEVWQTTFDGAAHDDDSWFARAALLGGDPVVGATLDEGAFYAFDVARLDAARSPATTSWWRSSTARRAWRSGGRRSPARVAAATTPIASSRTPRAMRSWRGRPMRRVFRSPTA